MAAARDWMFDAALEIVGGCRTVSSKMQTRAIIAKHCPMKDDTAYMEVPRCESCRFWDPATQEDQEEYAADMLDAVIRQEPGMPIEDMNRLMPRIGVCMRIDKDRPRAVVSKDGDLLTRSDYGCVLFEPPPGTFRDISGIVNRGPHG
jgi:hypothetical protein